MRRQRQKVQPQTPNSLEEYGNICLTNERFGLVDREPFCRGVVTSADSASVLFLSENLKTVLSEAKEIHIDGTFKTRPRHPESNQLLTVMAIQYGIVSLTIFHVYKLVSYTYIYNLQAFPCAFVLMEKRTVAAYNGVFLKLKDLLPSFKPTLVMTDFETALIKSLNENFPDAKKTGCFFHYCQVSKVVWNTLV